MAQISEGNGAIELGQTPPNRHRTEDQSVKQHLLTGESDIGLRQQSRLSENGIEHPANPLSTETPYSSDDEPKINVDSERLTVWLLECVALIISIGIIVAIVLVLRYYNGRQQPGWQGISLNSLISWLSTVAKACLFFSLTQSLGQLKWAWFSAASQPLSDLRVFDSASRGGVFGSLELLWRMKGHHIAAVGSHIAAFGSLATILSLGFDPFVQNLVHYVPDSIESPSQACLLGSTSRYNAAGPLIGGDFHYVDPVLKANVYNSLFNVNSTENWAVPEYTCATGNCTWDPIATLAIRPACLDITTKLNRTCVVDKEYKDFQNCTVSLGENGPSAWYYAGGSSVRAMDVSTTANALVHIDTIFPVIQYVLAVGSNTNPDATWDIVDTVNNQTTFIATECALELVVRSVQAEVSEGKYAETTTAEWAEQLSPNSTDATKYHIALSPPWNQSLGLATANQTFGIGYEAWGAISNFLAIFSGSVQAASGTFSFSAASGMYATTDVLEALFYNAFNTTGSSNNTKTGDVNEDIGVGVASCTDQLSCAVANVAAAMTKTIRDTAFTSSDSGADQSPVRGQTIVTVPFVKVHWEWLVLPVLVWILTCLVWLCAVLKTRRERTYKWANNPLPLLFLHDKRLGDEYNGGGGRGTQPKREECQSAPIEWTEAAIDRRAGMIRARLHTHGDEVMLS